MNLPLAQVADIVGTTIAKEYQQQEIKGLADLENAQDGDLSFFADDRYEKHLYSTKAKAIFVPEDFSPSQTLKPILIPIKDPKKALNKCLIFYERQQYKPKDKRETPHFIDDSVQIGKNVYIGAFAYIGANTIIADGVQIAPQVYIGENVQIGKDTTIGAGVKIYDKTEIGENVDIDFGAVLGSRGFGFMKEDDNTYTDIPQLGKVVIEDNVHIGANTTIDRATLGKTHIKKGTKIDGQVQIAHNVHIGKDSIMCAQVGIAGSTKVGDNVVLAGKVGVADHIAIADGTIILAGSGLGKTVAIKNQVLSGVPAVPNRQDRTQIVLIRRLPELLERIEQLEKKQL